MSEVRQNVDLFEYLALLFWQAVQEGNWTDIQQVFSWLDMDDEDEWGQCDVCLTYVPGSSLSERDRFQQRYCPECCP